MELLLSSPAMALIPDVYDSLLIFLHEACSQELDVLVCGSIYNGADLCCFAAFILLERSLIATDLSRRPVLPPPLWLMHDESVLLPRLPQWPD